MQRLLLISDLSFVLVAIKLRSLFSIHVAPLPPPSEGPVGVYVAPSRRDKSLQPQKGPPNILSAQAFPSLQASIQITQNKEYVYRCLKETLFYLPCLFFQLHCFTVAKHRTRISRKLNRNRENLRTSHPQA